MNFAIIGAGRIGTVHAYALRTIPGAHIAAVADPNLEHAATLAELCEIPRVFADPADAWTHDEVDAVIIASPTHLHAEQIIWAAQAGKHVFCEKPISDDIDEIEACLLAVERANVKLQIGFNRRFDPSFAAIKQALMNGELGAPHLLRITSRDPQPPPIEYVRTSGGLFFDMTIHDFDMALFLCGNVVRVHAFGGCRISQDIAEAGDIDTAVISLEFASGAFGTIDNSRQAVYGYDQRVELFGSRGQMSAGNRAPVATVLADANGLHASKPYEFFTERYRKSYELELRSFIESVREDRAVAVSGQDALAPVLLAQAAQRSLETGSTVTLDA